MPDAKQELVRNIFDLIGRLARVAEMNPKREKEAKEYLRALNELKTKVLRYDRSSKTSLPQLKRDFLNLRSAIRKTFKITR